MKELAEVRQSAEFRRTAEEDNGGVTTVALTREESCRRCLEMEMNFKQEVSLFVPERIYWLVDRGCQGRKATVTPSSKGSGTEGEANVR